MCGEVIKDAAFKRVLEDKNSELPVIHQRLSRGVLQVLAEAYLQVEFDIATIKDTPCLEIFLDADTDLGEEGLQSLSSFVRENIEHITPEDLGGISELLSGHSLRIDSDRIFFENNPQRRGAGRIYTPHDVTEHMCSVSITELMKNMKSAEEVISIRILDPAVGSGAFLSQAYRIILNQAAKQEIELKDEHKISLIQEVLHGVDVDPFAIKLTKLVMFLEYGGKCNSLNPSVFTANSLELGGSPSIEDWLDHIGCNSYCSGYDLVIGNPPYVRIKSQDFKKFQLADSRNLYGLFCELSLALTKSDGIFSMIIPQAIMGARDARSLRKHVLNLNAEVKFQVFDSVPDFLFDQGKIESNTNTNINQRTVIVTASFGKQKTIFTSQLLRWRRKEERNLQFENLNLVEIQPSDIHFDRIPMISNPETLAFLRAMIDVEQTIGDVRSEDGTELHMTKAVRYFISALPRDLGRPNTLHFKIDNSSFQLVHALLNSNVFYWWW
ncbi:MAG: N-6 DNA methylase, partial [Euryarchaeota archaeon]